MISTKRCHGQSSRLQTVKERLQNITKLYEKTRPSHIPSTTEILFLVYLFCSDQLILSISLQIYLGKSNSVF